MSCQHCVATIEENLGKLTGVKKVNVELELNEATVIHDEEKIKREEIIQAIEDSGYEVE